MQTVKSARQWGKSNNFSQQPTVYSINQAVKIYRTCTCTYTGQYVNMGGTLKEYTVCRERCRGKQAVRQGIRYNT